MPINPDPIDLVGRLARHRESVSVTLYLATDIRGGFYKHLTTARRRDDGIHITLCGLPSSDTQIAAPGVGRETALGVLADAREVGLPFCPHCSVEVEKGGR